MLRCSSKGPGCSGMGVTRRQMMGSAASLAAISVAMRNGVLPAQADEPSLFDSATPFSGDFVQNLAKDLASKPYKEEKVTLPSGLDALNFTQYRDIRFNPEKS